VEEDTERGREPLKFKPTEFERLNEAPNAAGGDAAPPGAPGALPAPPAESPKDVGEMLRQNAERDTAAGWYRAKPGPDRARRRRHLVYWSTLAAVDAPLGLLAWRSGHTDPVPFTLAIGGMAFFTGRLTWLTWFLRTD
jgi:hypothetical protein